MKTNPIIKTSQDSLNALVNNWQSKFVCCALKYIRKKWKAIASLSSRRWVYALRLYCLLSMMSRQKLCMWFYEPGITNVLNSFLKEPSLFCVFVLSWKRLRQKRFQHIVVPGCSQNHMHIFWRDIHTKSVIKSPRYYSHSTWEGCYCLSLFSYIF